MSQKLPTLSLADWKPTRDTLCVPKIRNTVNSKSSWYLYSYREPFVVVAKAE